MTAVPAKSFLRRSAPLFTLLLLVGISVFFILPIRSQPDVAAISTGRLERLGKALFKYAERHQGALPRRLRELSPPDFEPTEESTGIAGFIDPESEREFEWLYLPQRNLQTLASDTILIASPSAIPHQDDQRGHLVWRRNGTVASLREEEFFRAMEQQIRPEAK